VSPAHAEIAVVCERRRSLIRRRQRVLNEAEAVLSKLPLDLRAQHPARGTVLSRLRALATAEVASQTSSVAELVEWLWEMLALWSVATPPASSTMSRCRPLVFPLDTRR